MAFFVGVNGANRTVPMAVLSHSVYAEQVKSQLESAGLRVEVDYRNEKMGLKIREAEKQKIPYMLVIGDKEVENHCLAVRKRKVGNVGVMSVEAIIELFMEEMNLNM